MSFQPRARLKRIAIGGLPIVVLSAGCATTPARPEMKQRATLCLHRGMRFPENSAVRAQAIEAAAEVLDDPASTMMIREGLRDEHPGVRFAACMALGRLGDRASAEAFRKLADDADSSVRIGAFYALERIGDASYRRAWVEMMRNHASPEARRNAVMALGLLGDPRTKDLLTRVAAEDPDDGVRLQAVEGLALLGDADAESGFIRDAFGGLGYRQPFALLALGKVKSPDSLGVLRSRLVNAPYLEAKLAAARGLALQGHLDGFRLALDSLAWTGADPNMPNDPPENQMMRVHTMAAMALGDMRDPEALPALHSCMETAGDPRVQIAAARSILKILAVQEAGPPEPSG